MASSVFRCHGASQLTPFKVSKRRSIPTRLLQEWTPLHPALAQSGRNLASVQIAAIEHKPLAEQVQGKRSGPSASGNGGKRVTCAQLSKRIRACTSVSQLLELYGRYGACFHPTNAYEVFHRLVDLAPDPSSRPASPAPSPSSSPLSSTDPQNPSGAPGPWGPQGLGNGGQPYVQHTGRLIVRQGQDAIAQPSSMEAQPASAFSSSSLTASSSSPVEDTQEEDAGEEDRRNSNYQASTSGPSGLETSANQEPRPNPHPQQQQQQQHPGLLAGAFLPQHSGQQNRRKDRRKRGGPGNHPVRSRNGAASASLYGQLGGPTRQQVAQMASALAAVLSHGCSQLNTVQGVASAAYALARMRYNDPALVEQLEQRFITLEERMSLREQEQARQQQQQQQQQHEKEQGREQGRTAGSQAKRKAGLQEQERQGQGQKLQQQQQLARSGTLGDTSTGASGLAEAGTGAGGPCGTRDPVGCSAQPPWVDSGAAAAVDRLGGPTAGGAGIPGAQQVAPAALLGAEAIGPLQEQQPAGADSSSPEGGRPPAATSSPRWRAPSAPRTSTFSDICQMVSAFGLLGHKPSQAWLRCVEACTLPCLRECATAPAGRGAGASRVPLLLSDLASCGARPSVPWLQAACAATQPHLGSYTGPQIIDLLEGLSGLKHRPEDGWVEAFLAATEPHLAGRYSWQLEELIGAMAALGCRPGQRWLERFYQSSLATVGAVGGMTGSQAAAILSSLASLDCKPTSDWINTLLMGTRRSLVNASSQQLTDMLAALARLRFRPPEPWLEQYYAASFQRMSFHTPQQCGSAVASLARLNRRPRPLWLEEMGQQLGGQLALLPGGQQAAAVASLAELGFAPGREWLAAYEKASNPRLAECTAEELCRALAALAKMRFKPNASWLYSFIMAAYAQLDSFDAAQLALVFDRLPSLGPHGSWLDEIVQICAAETTMRAQAAQQERRQQEPSPEEEEAAAVAVTVAASEGGEESVSEGRQAEGWGAIAWGPVTLQGESLKLQQQEQQQQQQQQQVWASSGAEGSGPAAGTLEARDGLLGQPADVSTVEAVSASVATELVAADLQSEDAAAPFAAATAAVGAAGLGQASAGLNGRGPAASTGGAGEPDALVAAEGGPLAAVAAGPAAACSIGTGAFGDVSDEAASAGACAAADLGGEADAARLAGARVAAIETEVTMKCAGILNGRPEPYTAVAAALAIADTVSTADAASGTSADAAPVILAEPFVDGGAAIAISSDLVPAAGGVVSEGAPYGLTSNGPLAPPVVAVGADDDIGVPPIIINGIVMYGANGDAAASELPAVQLVTVGVVSADEAGEAVNGATTTGLRINGAGGSSSSNGAAGRRGGNDTGGPDKGNSNGSGGSGTGSGGAGGRTIVFPGPMPGSGRAGDIAVLPKPQRVPAPAAAALAAGPTGAPGTEPGSGPNGAVGAGSDGALGGGAGGIGGASNSVALYRPSMPVPAPAAAAAASPASRPSTPMLPSSAAAAPVPPAPASGAKEAAADSSNGTGPAPAAAAASSVADYGRVQYLDSESLYKLIGAPDGPPGPDFSGCQKRAATARAVRRVGGPYGIFRLGRVWTNEGGEGLGGAGAGGMGPTGQPVPSPSG